MTTSKLEGSTVPPGLTNAGKGRKKGVPNKLTKCAKEAFQAAFDTIGGAEALGDWAQENRTEFYKLFARLIPTEQQHSGPGGGAIPITWPLPQTALDQ